MLTGLLYTWFECYIVVTKIKTFFVIEANTERLKVDAENYEKNSHDTRIRI